MTDAAAPRVSFPNLDGLRFVAFFLVFTQHAWLPTVPQLGAYGVSFFFVLSGFLITYLILTEIDARGKLDVPGFYLRRFARIWPLYFVVVAFGFVVYPAVKTRLHLDAPIANDWRWFALFLGNFDVIRVLKTTPELNVGLIGIMWSVCIEEQFYLIWPLQFRLLPARLTQWVFPSVIVGSTMFRALHANDANIVYYHSLSVISDLALGGMCAYHAIHSPRFLKFAKELSPGALILGYLVGGAVLVAGDRVFGVVAGRLLTTLFFAFVIVEQCFAARTFGVARLRFATFWGKYTYGLYLLHPISIQLVHSFRRPLHIGDGAAATVELGAAALALSLGLAYASYELYERRFLRWSRRFSHVAR